MAVSSLCYTIPIRCTSNANSHDPSKQKFNNMMSFGKPESVSQTAGAASTYVGSVSDEKVYMNKVQIRQNIPTKKQFVDQYRQGLIIEGGVGYRQTVVIRSYEVGPDKTATLESILNLFQETALNHVWMSGLLGNGFGATHGMMKNGLIWVVSRMELQVDHYPIWYFFLQNWIGVVCCYWI